MITLYSGTPGSGKSLHVAERIYYRLRSWRPVICNFEINLKNVHKRKYKHLKYTYIDNYDLNPDYLIDYAFKYFSTKGRIKENDILLVIDECQLIFNSREWHKQGRAAWLSFFSQHRKYGYEIILVAQYDGMIDKQIRCLIEYNCIHRKVSNFGIFGFALSIFSFGKLFCSVKYWYPLNEKISSEFFKAHKKYYKLYDTFGFFSDPDKEIKKTDNTDESLPTVC